MCRDHTTEPSLDRITFVHTAPALLDYCYPPLPLPLPLPLLLPAPIGETMRLWRRKRTVARSSTSQLLLRSPNRPRTEKKTDSRNDRQRKTQFVNSFPLINNGDADRMRGTLPLSPYELLGGQTARAGRDRNAPPLWVGRDR